MQSSLSVLRRDSAVTAYTAPAALAEVGLTAADLPSIHSIHQQIADQPESIAAFGREVADVTSQFADGLLDEVRNGDLGAIGERLSQVVSAAQSLNLGVLSKPRSRIPVVGKWIDRITLMRSQVMQKFETTREQVDGLLKGIASTQEGLAVRVETLRVMHAQVQTEYRLLGAHIIAGRMKTAELKTQVAELKQRASTPDEHLRVADLERLHHQLDKRVGDLVALQHSALQSLPMIRVMETNNAALIEKFHTIKEITIPAWKRQFMLALALNEQRNAVELAETIDNATNEFLNRNAQLLHQNAVQTAKANQRLVIDVDTLQNVHKQLLATVDDVRRIHREGAKLRSEAEAKIAAMRKQLTGQLSGNEATKSLPHAPESAAPSPSPSATS